MLDILGKEVKRGDVVVYGVTQLWGFNKFTKTNLGVVSKVIQGGRQYQLRDRSGKSMKNMTGTVQMMTAIDKVSFYPLDSSIMMPQNIRLTKHGKRRYNPLLSTTFLIINKEELTGNYPLIYEQVCKDFKLC